MPQMSRYCSIKQGFDFKKDVQHTVGHLVSIKIGDTQLAADIELKDPMNPETAVKVVGVISNIDWATGVTDPVYIGCNISTPNKTNLAALTYNTMIKTDVVFKFNIYEFDPQAKKYFLCFHSNAADMNGLIFKEGGDLALSVSTDPDNEVQSPLNYPMMIGIKPQPSAQSLHLATGDQKNVVKAWGITNA